MQGVIFFPKVKWYADLTFETVNAMKLWRVVDAASTPVPEVEDDMNVNIVISSDAPKLSSALIQLELEAFQLGLACGIFGSSLKNLKTFTAMTILPIILEVLWYLWT